MKTSQYFLPTQRQTPADAELPSHQLMVKSGMIRKLASGLYTWLPLGYRVLKKVETIVREELDQAGCLELLMPAIQPAELWKQTERWEQFGSELLKINDRHQRDFCFGPTHEEVITDLVKNEIHSYKQLPLTLYQIQTKFRDEIRPRYGVMRAREFLMKDAYSFHIDKPSLEATYHQLFDVYQKIFTRLGLKFTAVLADSGSIGGDLSHEFHVLADSGEDQILYTEDGKYAANIEIASKAGLKEGDTSPNSSQPLKLAHGIEVGHIFQLGDKYSQAMGANVLNQGGKSTALLMGCYGIGISRIVAAAIEQNHDDNGIIWPAAISPFDIAIAPINYHKSYRVKELCETLYQQLTQQGYNVLLDDRKERPGVIFSDMDLIGAPKQIIIGEKNIDQQQLELKSRQTGNVEIIPIDQLLTELKD